MTNDRIDDRIETGLRAALLADDPGEVPSALRMRVASIPERIPGPRRPARIGWPSRRLAWIEGVAAVALIVVLTGVTLVSRGSNVGPAASSSASAPPTENPVASPTKTPIVTPTRSPNGDAWGGLSWSAPSEITTWGIPSAKVRRAASTSCVSFSIFVPSNPSTSVRLGLMRSGCAVMPLRSASPLVSKKTLALPRLAILTRPE